MAYSTGENPEVNEVGGGRGAEGHGDQPYAGGQPGYPAPPNAHNDADIRSDNNGAYDPKYDAAKSDRPTAGDYAAAAVVLAYEVYSSLKSDPKTAANTEAAAAEKSQAQQTAAKQTKHDSYDGPMDTTSSTSEASDAGNASADGEDAKSKEVEEVAAAVKAEVDTERISLPAPRTYQSKADRESAAAEAADESGPDAGAGMDRAEVEDADEPVSDWGDEWALPVSQSAPRAAPHVGIYPALEPTRVKGIQMTDETLKTMIWMASRGYIVIDRDGRIHGTPAAIAAAERAIQAGAAGGESQAKGELPAAAQVPDEQPDQKEETSGGLVAEKTGSGSDIVATTEAAKAGGEAGPDGEKAEGELEVANTQDAAVEVNAQTVDTALDAAEAATDVAQAAVAAVTDAAAATPAAEADAMQPAETGLPLGPDAAAVAVAAAVVALINGGAAPASGEAAVPGAAATGVPMYETPVVTVDQEGRPIYVTASTPRDLPPDAEHVDVDPNEIYGQNPVTGEWVKGWSDADSEHAERVEAAERASGRRPGGEGGQQRPAVHIHVHQAPAKEVYKYDPQRQPIPDTPLRRYGGGGVRTLAQILQMPFRIIFSSTTVTRTGRNTYVAVTRKRFAFLRGGNDNPHQVVVTASSEREALRKAAVDAAIWGP